jgi:hypothetical protein
MIILNDVWVNWFESEENGYNVHEFFEWKRDEKAALFDAVPLLKVTPELFDYIENDLLEIPQALLDKVKNKAAIRRNHERIVVPYAFIISDGRGVLAVETLNYNIPMKKSRLIPRQEIVVLETIEDRNIDFDLPKELEREKQYHTFSPHPNIMIGLTRKERQLKQLLLMALDDIYDEGNLAKLQYIFAEWDISNYINIKNLDLDALFTRFIAEVSQGWSERHHELTKLIIHNKPFYTKIYELETA